MKVDDGLAAESGFEEGEVIDIVMEKVLAECGGIGVDVDQADVSLAHLAAAGVDALDADAEGDVVVFGDEEVGIVAGVFQLPDDGGGDLPGVAPFVVAAVRGALAGGVG